MQTEDCVAFETNLAKIFLVGEIDNTDSSILGKKSEDLEKWFCMAV